MIIRERVHFDKFSVLVTPAGYQLLKVYTIPDNSVVRFELTVAARQTDGANRAMFKRIGLFYRQSAGAVQIQGPTWHTVDTQKSDLNMSVKYVLGATTLTIQVRNAGSVSTRYTGHVDLIAVL